MGLHAHSLAYFGLSVSYSFYLKRKLMVDVVALAMLYGIRVLAGAAATGIALSHWLSRSVFHLFKSCIGEAHGRSDGTGADQRGQNQRSRLSQ